MPTSRPEFLRTIFDALPIAVCVADDTAHYVDVNAAGCQLLRRERDALIGLHVSDVLAPGRSAEIDVQWQAFLRDGEQHGVIDLRMPDGAMRRVSFNATANVAPGLHCSFMSEVATASATSAPRVSSAELVTICAWTKRVRAGERWVSIEQYLLDAHGVLVSHGMSPDALRRVSDGTWLR